MRRRGSGAPKRHFFKWLVYKGDKVRIDKEIAPLLSNMWKLGIGTAGSCESVCSPKCKHKTKKKPYKDGILFYHNNTKHCYDRVWIVFVSPKDVIKFYNIVAEYEKDNSDTIYNHMHGYYYKKYPNDSWCLETYMENEGVLGHWKRTPGVGMCWEDDCCPKNKFNLHCQLWFPRKHLKYVEARIEQALKRKKK